MRKRQHLCPGPPFAPPIRTGDAWLDGLLNYLDGNRQLLAELVKEHLPKAVLTPMEATYLGWLDLRAYGFTCDQLEKMTHEAGVAFTAGTFFGRRRRRLPAREHWLPRRAGRGGHPAAEGRAGNGRKVKDRTSPHPIGRGALSAAVTITKTIGGRLH